MTAILATCQINQWHALMYIVLSMVASAGTVTGMFPVTVRCSLRSYWCVCSTWPCNIEPEQPLSVMLHASVFVYRLNASTLVCMSALYRYAKQRKPVLSSVTSNTGSIADSDDDFDSSTYNVDLGLKQAPNNQAGPRQSTKKTTKDPASAATRAADSAVKSKGLPSAIVGSCAPGFPLESDAPSGKYSEDVLRSVQVVDPSIINYELIEALLVHIAGVQHNNGSDNVLQVGCFIEQANLLLQGIADARMLRVTTLCSHSQTYHGGKYLLVGLWCFLTSAGLILFG